MSPDPFNNDWLPTKEEIIAAIIGIALFAGIVFVLHYLTTPKVAEAANIDNVVVPQYVSYFSAPAQSQSTNYNFHLNNDNNIGWWQNLARKTNEGMSIWFPVDLNNDATYTLEYEVLTKSGADNQCKIALNVFNVTGNIETFPTPSVANHNFINSTGTDTLVASFTTNHNYVGVMVSSTNLALASCASTGVLFSLLKDGEPVYIVKSINDMSLPDSLTFLDLVTENFIYILLLIQLLLIIIAAFFIINR